MSSAPPLENAPKAPDRGADTLSYPSTARDRIARKCASTSGEIMLGLQKRRQSGDSRASMGVCVFSWLSAPCVLSCYCRVVRRMFAVDARLVLCGAVGAVVFPVVFVYLLLGCLLCLLVFVATLPCPKCRRRSLGHMVAATFRSLFIGPWGPGESLARAALVITAPSFVSRSRRCCTLLVHAASRLRYLFCCSRVMRPWLLRA